MNCIDKMYKEIEEIIKKEQEERFNDVRPVKEIKRGFSASFDSVEEVDNSVIEVPTRNFLSEISLEGKKITKKYFDRQKSIKFVNYIFSKYLCFNGASVSKQDVNSFFESLNVAVEGDSNLIDVLVEYENKFISIAGVDMGEVTEKYFLNHYNALFSDDKGYYAVIEDGKFSDVRRPIGYRPEQIKKLVKEVFDGYLVDFKSKFSSDKEYATFVNGFKAEINKADISDPIAVLTSAEERFFNFLEKKGVSKTSFDGYLNQKGLKLVKQGGFYFEKKAYEAYAEYKKIEFRY